MVNSKKLLYFTTRIESTFSDGTALGTGFFYSIKTSKGDVPGIITNRHVLEDEDTGEIATNSEFRINLSKTDANEPELGKFKIVDYPNIDKNIIFHPKEEIDLAFVPIAPILNNLTKNGDKPYYIQLNKDLIPNDETINKLSSLEDIYMIGYPSGIFDDTNNLPIIRKGTTATPVYADYEGDKEFLIDITVFEGSSGSPVLIYHDGKYGALTSGEKFVFLGILYSGYDETMEGEIIRKKNKPKKESKLVAKTEIPLNLGIVIKAELLNDFEPILEKKVNSAQQSV